MYFYILCFFFLTFIHLTFQFLTLREAWIDTPCTVRSIIFLFLIIIDKRNLKYILHVLYFRTFINSSVGHMEYIGYHCLISSIFTLSTNLICYLSNKTFFISHTSLKFLCINHILYMKCISNVVNSLSDFMCSLTSLSYSCVCNLFTFLSL